MASAAAATAVLGWFDNRRPRRPQISTTFATAPGAALELDDLDWLKGGIADGLAESERDPKAMLHRALGAVLAGGDLRLSAITSGPFGAVDAVGPSDMAAWQAERVVMEDPGALTSLMVDIAQTGRRPGSSAIKQAADMTLGGVNDALGELIPSEVTAVVVTPEPESLGARCVVDVPEEASACGM